MATTVSDAEIRTVADLLERLGDVAPARVRMDPKPGTATVQDALDIARRENRLYELVDGTLVEKVMGCRESVLAIALGAFLRAFVIPRNLGFVTGEAGTMQLFGGLLRIPDVAFVSWDRVPGGRIPEEPVPRLAPNLAVEVLSKGNTPGEMSRKRHEFFEAGVELVWQVDPRARTVAVYTSPEEHMLLSEDQTLDGGDVLQGFTLPLRELFAELDRTANG
jgi:Uma2 family endonuclease